MRTHGQVDARMPAGSLGDGTEVSGVVGVDADEDFVVLVLDGGEIVLQHVADDAVLVPQGHKESDPALGRVFQVRVRRPAEAAPGRTRETRLMNRSSSPLSRIQSASGTRQIDNHWSSHTKNG